MSDNFDKLSIIQCSFPIFLFLSILLFVLFRFSLFLVSVSNRRLSQPRFYHARCLLPVPKADDTFVLDLFSTFARDDVTISMHDDEFWNGSYVILEFEVSKTEIIAKWIGRAEVLHMYTWTTRSTVFSDSYIWATSQENLSSGFATRVDSNRPAQPQKLGSGLKFRI